jgi:hypothetical protein
MCMSRLLPLCALLTALLVGTSACPPGPGPVPPAPPQDAGLDASAATCGSACDRWRELGCEQAEDTADGATCEDVCDNIQSSGIIEWDLACRASVADCAAIDACER